MPSKYGFETQQERQDEKEKSQETERALREKQRSIIVATVQRIGPIIQDFIAGYFAGMGLSITDDAGVEHAVLFKEEEGIKEHKWKAWSRKKTGSHTEYLNDGAHVLDEHTVFNLTINLVVDKDCVPLLNIGDYGTSKLVGGIPIPASYRSLEIPGGLEGLLQSKTGIKVVGLREYVAA